MKLCQAYGGKLPADKRAYRVTLTSGTLRYTRYVFSNSPGQAAMATCEVERVTDKELVKAAFEAMGVK